MCTVITAANAAATESLIPLHSTLPSLLSFLSTAEHNMKLNFTFLYRPFLRNLIRAVNTLGTQQHDV